MRMKFVKFDSVLPGLKHEHVTDFSGRDRLLSSWIINEFLNLFYSPFVARWMHCNSVKIVRLRKMWEGQRARERPRGWALAIGESVYWHNGFSVAQHCYLSHTSLRLVMYISDWVLVFLVWTNRRFCYLPYGPTNEVREIVILCRRMVWKYTWRENTQLGYTAERLAH